MISDRHPITIMMPINDTAPPAFRAGQADKPLRSRNMTA